MISGTPGEATCSNKPPKQNKKNKKNKNNAGKNIGKSKTGNKRTAGETAAQSSFLRIGQEFPQSSAELVEQERARKDQEYVEALLQTVQMEALKYRTSRKTNRNVAIGFGLVVAVLVVAFVMRGMRTGNWDAGDWFIYFNMFTWFGGAVAASQSHKKAASELAEIDDIRAVGPLAESLDIDDRSVRALVQSGLIRLLPRLQASDASLLNATQRACLNRALNGSNEVLVLSVLKAYEQVGEETALPFVEKLATETAHTTRSSHITKAAQECREFLRARVERQRASQTLLRGASAIDVAPDTLLRPAQETGSDPEQLLRADLTPVSRP